MLYGLRLVSQILITCLHVYTFISYHCVTYTMDSLLKGNKVRIIHIILGNRNGRGSYKNSQYIDITIHVHRVIYLLDTRIDTAILHMDTLFRQCKEMFWANNTLLISEQVGHNITALLGSCG